MRHMCLGRDSDPEPPASERPQTDDLDRAAIAIGEKMEKECVCASMCMCVVPFGIGGDLWTMQQIGVV
jgi:hypothetical protein